MGMVKGFQRQGEIIDLGVDNGIIEKSGSCSTVTTSTKLGQGKEAVKNLLKDNPELLDELESKVK